MINVDDLFDHTSFDVDRDAHIVLDAERCASCEARYCTTACPARCYAWSEKDRKITFVFAGCLECGTCFAVTAVAIGDARLDDALRLALAVGAGRAVRVWDDAMRDGDAAADATVLQRVLEIVRPALFVSGHRLLDRGDDPAAALAAARFGMPCVGAALSCALRGD